MLLFCLSTYASPAIALLLGLLLALSIGNPYTSSTSRCSKLLLQASVVGLGFALNLQQIIRAGRSGSLYTVIGISLTLLCGVLLGRVLRVPAKLSPLISVGTAI